MKKLAFVLVLLISSLTTAWSQVSFGLKAGVNFANQSFSGSGISLNTSAYTGFHGGVYAVLKFGKFGLQPEAYYSMQGSKVNLQGIGSGDFKFDYINVPILFRYNVTNFLNLHIGPQFGILMSAKTSSGGVSQDIKSQVNSLDFSVAGGIGVDLPFGIIGGVRYVGGLTNFEKGSTNGETGKNNIIQIYVGYKLFGK